MSDLNYSLGIDIGSTTVKVALLGAEGKILFSDYERHFANIQSTLASLIEKAVNSLGKDISVHPVITGSGGLSLGGESRRSVCAGGGRGGNLLKRLCPTDRCSN